MLMKMIEKIDGKDLRDKDIKKDTFRCKNCDNLLRGISGKNIIEITIVCDQCKTVNKFK